jgi:hypothetical protein
MTSDCRSGLTALHLIRSTDWCGDSVSVLIDKLMNQLLTTDYILATGKARNFHVAVIEDIHLKPLANERDGHENSIVPMPRQSEVDMRVLQLSHQTVKGVRHTYAERCG